MLKEKDVSIKFITDMSFHNFIQRWSETIAFKRSSKKYIIWDQSFQEFMMENYLKPAFPRVYGGRILFDNSPSKS